MIELLCTDYNKKATSIHYYFGNAVLNEVLTGYYHYYGITDNSRSLNSFNNVVWFRLFYWLNRRSQRRSYTKEGYKELMRQFPLVRPRIYVSIYG